MNPQHEQAPKTSIFHRISSELEIDTRMLAMIGALLIIWIVLTVLTNGIFFTARNLYNLAVQTSVGDQHVGLAIAQGLEQVLCALETARLHVRLLERFLKHPAHLLVVIDDPDVKRGPSHWSHPDRAECEYRKSCALVGYQTRSVRRDG